LGNIYLYIIRLRGRQLFRLLSNTGFALIVIALLLTIGATVPLIQRILSLPSYTAILFSLISIIVIHQKRPDSDFLKTIFYSKRSLKKLYAIEYILLSMPIAIFQLFNGHYSIFLSVIAIPFIISQFRPFRNSSKNKKPINFNIIPLDLFEIKFAVERRWLLYSLVYVVSFLSTIHISFIILSLFGYCMLVLEAFGENEGPEMLLWNHNFLLQKWFRYAKITVMLYFTPISIGILSYPDQAFLFAYLFSFVMVHLFMVISFKYSNYNPLFKSQGNNSILALIFILSIFPGAILISFPFGIHHYFKAKNHLNRIYA